MVGQVGVEQAGMEARVVNVKVVPVPVSVTFIGKIPTAGAVTVVPEAVHVGTEVPAQTNGIQVPPGQLAQLTDVDVLAHVYVPLPPLAVNEPEFIHNVTVPQDNTLTVTEPTPQARLYVIT